MSENLPQPPAWFTVATGMLIIIAVLVFARLAFGLVLPAMREGLGLSYQQAGNLGTATALGYLALVLYAGVVAARRGGRFAVMLGIGITTAGFVGLSLVPGGFWRRLSGAGGGNFSQFTPAPISHSGGGYLTTPGQIQRTPATGSFLRPQSA